MHEWERAALEFLESWPEDPRLVGALLAGSYVTGTPSPRSDLDMVLVLAPGTTWRERGNRVVRGFLVEYFANSAKQYRNYFKSDHAHWCGNTANMFVTGRILHDPRGHVERLRVQAERWSKRPLPRPKRAALAADRYHLWDMLDNLCDLQERGSPGLTHAYHHYVQHVYEVYTRFLRAPVLPADQLHDYLTSSRARAKYRLDDAVGVDAELVAGGLEELGGERAALLLVDAPADDLTAPDIEEHVEVEESSKHGGRQTGDVPAEKLSWSGSNALLGLVVHAWFGGLPVIVLTRLFEHAVHGGF